MKDELRRAVFLDRDGVLNSAVVRNGKPYPPSDLPELQIVQDAPEALSALRKAGFLLIGVTNQPDVARGTQRREVVETINSALLAALPLQEILVCYHDDKDRCSCRKPKPGLLIQAAEKYGIDLRSSFIIGDRWRDVQAGQNAGCRSVFIDYGYSEVTSDGEPHHKASSLSEAVAWVLAQSSQAGGVG